METLVGNMPLLVVVWSSLLEFKLGRPAAGTWFLPLRLTGAIMRCLFSIIDKRGEALVFEYNARVAPTALHFSLCRSSFGVGSEIFCSSETSNLAVQVGSESGNFLTCNMN